MTVARQTTLIATLGGQPQVVTLALDALLSRAIPINEVVVLHFASGLSRTQHSIHKLTAEFTNGQYGEHAIELTLLPLMSVNQAMADIRDEADANAAWESINQLIINLKEQHQTLHVCISGGRRILGLMTMSAAMLHFGHQDALWHMYTPEEWIAEAKDGALMHIPADLGFNLIQVPMMPWGSYFPALRMLTMPSALSTDVLAAPRKIMDYGEEAKKTAVIHQLTPRQKEVLHAFGEGLDPRQVADKLFITVKTVDSHKTVILAECRNAWNLPEEAW
ncbi:MAG: histidine kinase, partial [Chloroflexi bacterium]|nr:histidine kinase [Chloroflexota bacterium]